MVGAEWVGVPVEVRSTLPGRGVAPVRSLASTLAEQGKAKLASFVAGGQVLVAALIVHRSGEFLRVTDGSTLGPIPSLLLQP